MQGFKCLLILFFSIEVFAAEKITVTVGQGRLSLQMNDLHLDEQSKKELETALLINKKLQAVVDSKEVRTIVLEGEAVDKIHRSLKLAKEQAQRQIQVLVENQFHGAAIPPPIADDEPAIIRTGETQMVMGSKFHVYSGEFLQQLVSFGSDVTIEGEVAELVAIGGRVVLKSGARISKELIMIGSQLEQEEGSNIAQLTSGLQWHGIDHHFFDFDDYDFQTLFWVVFGKIVLLFLLGWLWFKMAPQFQQDVQTQLRKKPIASFFWSLFAILLFIPSVILLIVSIVGIMFLPLLVLLYVFFWLMAEVHWARFIAQRLPLVKSQHLLIQIFCGLIVFELVDRALPPFLTWIPYLFLAIGFGAIFSQFLRRGIAWRN